MLTDVRSASQVAESIMTMLKQRGVWHRYSQAGYDRAFSQFRISLICNQYLEEYDNMVHRKSIKRCTPLAI